MNIVKRYEITSIKPTCAEEDEHHLVVRLETKDAEHRNIDIKIQKQAIKWIADQIH
jgi:hypothetical protein